MTHYPAKEALLRTAQRLMTTPVVMRTEGSLGLPGDDPATGRSACMQPQSAIVQTTSVNRRCGQRETERIRRSAYFGERDR